MGGKTKITEIQLFFAHVVWKSRSGYELRHKGQLFFTTVALKLNQGTTPGKYCYLSRLPFFGSFLGKQKRTYSKEQKKNKCLQCSEAEFLYYTNSAHITLAGEGS